MNITDQELEMLSNCLSEEEWGRACDQIKKVRGGQYPPDWWARVKQSGLLTRVLARFGQDDGIHLIIPLVGGSQTPVC